MRPDKLLGYVRRGGYVSENLVPFQEILPLKLKNSVSGKSERGSGVACIQEMSIMFACLKKNEFEESLCPKEITSFQKCCKDNAMNRSAQRAKEKKGILAPGEKNLGHKQIKELLKNYPS